MFYIVLIEIKDTLRAIVTYISVTEVWENMTVLFIIYSGLKRKYFIKEGKSEFFQESIS